MASQPPLDAATQQAIDWMVRLSSGRVQPAERQAFERWQAADPAHAQAWERLQDTVGRPVGALRAVDSRQPGQAQQARQLLLQPRRRTALKGLAVVASAGVGLLLLDRWQPLGAVLADYSTGTGQRARFALPDGSTLVLNARSRVNLAFDEGLRRLRLLEGDIVVQVAADVQRPLVVSTAQADIRALGTQFAVEQLAERTQVRVLESRVELRSLSGESAVLGSGEAAQVDAAGLQRLAADQMPSTEWQRGWLVVQQRPLHEVIAQLQRYRHGLLRVSPEAAQIQVQGVFPLDDIERALTGLAETLPIRVQRFGSWLTRIDVR